MKKIPLILLTGFLGSGKTTLLNELLKAPELENSLVLINELGEIALDHRLVEASAQNTALLDNGCLCCTVIGALASTLRGLYWQRHDKKIPHFDRIIIETTGLADPAPILHELLKHPTILHDYELAGVITCVDALFGEEQLSVQPEAYKQAVLADVLLLTKTDLVSAEAVAALSARLRTLNPFADVRSTIDGVAPDVVLNNPAYNPQGKTLEAQRWLKAESYLQVPAVALPTSQRRGFGLVRSAPNVANANTNAAVRHDESIKTISLTLTRPLSLSNLIAALHKIAAKGGSNLLRVKGILDLAGKDKPSVIHGIQYKFFPITTLTSWGGAPRQSVLVFIVKGMDLGFIAEAIEEGDVYQPDVVAAPVMM